MPNLHIGTFILKPFPLRRLPFGKDFRIDFPDGSYHGEIDKNGKKNGKGIYKWLDGSTYEGDFEEDLRHGNGLFQWANGESYKGDYLGMKERDTGFTIGRTEHLTKVLFSMVKDTEKEPILVPTERIAGTWFDDMQHGEGTLPLRRNGRRGNLANGKLLTVPAVIPPKAGKPKLTWKQSAAVKEKETSNIPLIPKEPLDTQSLDFPPVATHTLPGATGSAPEGAENPELPTRETPPSTELDSGHAADTDFQETKTEDLTPETKGPSSKRWSGEDQNVWEGNREEAELYFATYLINGIDTIFEKKTKAPFSGKMRVTDLEENF